MVLWVVGRVTVLSGGVGRSTTWARWQALFTVHHGHVTRGSATIHRL